MNERALPTPGIREFDEPQGIVEILGHLFVELQLGGVWLYVWHNLNMQMQQFDELGERATAGLNSQVAADMDQAGDAAKAINTELAAMRDEDKILILSDEEERMLRSFRGFKSTCQKPGAVFKWQTHPETGITTPPDSVPVEDLLSRAMNCIKFLQSGMCPALTATNAKELLDEWAKRKKLKP